MYSWFMNDPLRKLVPKVRVRQRCWEYFPKFWVFFYKLRDCVQTTWTEFWAILTPLPLLCRHFYLTVLLSTTVVFQQPLSPLSHLSTWCVYAPISSKNSEISARKTFLVYFLMKNISILYQAYSMLQSNSAQNLSSLQKESVITIPFENHTRVHSLKNPVFFSLVINHFDWYVNWSYVWIWHYFPISKNYDDDDGGIARIVHRVTTRILRQL